MKQYKSIEETIADVRKKDKKYNYIILIVVLLMVSVIASLIIYAQDKKNKVIQQENYSLGEENKVNQELIEKYQFEFIENERLRRNDSLRTDSITVLVKTLRMELARIERDLNTKSIPRTDRATALTSVNLAQDKLNRITNNISDHTIVRYYKRKADGSKIERLIQGMKSPSFNLNLMPVANDNGRYKVNSIHYGRNVSDHEVAQLVKRLESIGVEIKSVTQFSDTKANVSKGESIEIEYIDASRLPTKTKNDSTLQIGEDIAMEYNVRLYSFNPDESIKKELSLLIRKGNYNLKTYPNWKAKPSFFASVPTIFYYANSSKEKAEKLKENLNKSINGVRFVTQRGSGYGISKSELDNTFIVHYMQ